MEPGHEDREYDPYADSEHDLWTPQWSPVMKTGNTWGSICMLIHTVTPQWSPVMKTGNTRSHDSSQEPCSIAPMEPGHEDREYSSPAALAQPRTLPQWSPVMKTGNTGSSSPACASAARCLNGARS